MAKFDRPHIQYFSLAPFPLHAGIAFNKNDFDRELKRLGISETDYLAHSNAAATTHIFERRKPNHGTACIITLDMPHAKKRSISQVAALLAHEATHVWQACEDCMGEKNAGAEVEAYFIQWVTQCAVDAYLEAKKTPNSKKSPTTKSV